MRRFKFTKAMPRGPPDNPLNVKFIKDPPFPGPYHADGCGKFDHITSICFCVIGLSAVVKYLFPKHFNYDEAYLIKCLGAPIYAPKHPAEKAALEKYKKGQTTKE